MVSPSFLVLPQQKKNSLCLYSLLFVLDFTNMLRECCTQHLRTEITA